MNHISFEGRVVVVTGAGGGIGRTYAHEIARRGGSVVVNDLGGDIRGDHSSPAMADGVVGEIRKAGGRAMANADSVVSLEGAQRMISTAIDAFGRIDAVINNAGIMRNNLFENAREKDIDAVIDTHLRGSINVTRAAWPHMKRQSYGRVVFTSSSTGMFGNERQACYGAAKAGIVGLMNVLSLEGAAHGIRCNAVMPMASGRMSEQMAKDMSAAELSAAVAAIVDAGNSFEPGFNTSLGVFLASEACESTHSIYSCCCGRIARVFIGVTPGWQGSRTHPSTVEEIAAHFGEIADLSGGFGTPATPYDEIQMILGTRAGGKLT
jgi:NAD(P)-dependent dehydrogenase (short-subunit alcohol dehydrogenase family)